MSGQADLAHKAVHRVDVSVGARIRVRRRFLGVTQHQLAEALNLTFQQVQKYEKGTNRVSASKLYEIARTLEVPVSFFFDAPDEPAVPGPDATAVNSVTAFLMTSEGIELARLFPKIRRGALRRAVLNFVRSAVDGGEQVDSDDGVLATTQG